MLLDLRFALRSLRQNPGLTTFALLALAIGIGAGTTVFSVVNQALLKPPPYREPNRLVLLQSIDPKRQAFEGYSSWDDFQDLSRESKTLTTIAGVSPRWSFTLHLGGGAEQVHGQWVSASLFSLLGVSPILGRGFTEAEDRPGTVQVVVLSYELWQRGFGAAPSVVGQQIKIDSFNATVIGIMPRGFRFLDDAELWLPLAANFLNERGRGVRYFSLAARLAPGESIQQSRTELAGIMDELERKYPNSNTGFSAQLHAAW